MNATGLSYPNPAWPLTAAGVRGPPGNRLAGTAVGNMGDLETRALRGEDSAWNVLIRKHDRRVWATLLALGASPDVASDVAQETWVKLVQRARGGQLAELKLPGLAITQARFLYLNRLEATRPTVSTDDEDHPLHLADSGVDAEERLASAQELERVMQAIQACPERSRAILTSVYDEGMSAAEASARFGISVQRVRQTLCEVRASLRAALGGRR